MDSELGSLKDLFKPKPIMQNVVGVGDLISIEMQGQDKPQLFCVLECVYRSFLCKSIDGGIEMKITHLINVP